MYESYGNLTKTEDWISLLLKNSQLFCLRKSFSDVVESPGELHTC